MTTGPKITRKEFKDDKVYLTMAEVVDYVIRNRTTVALAALAVIAVFAAGYYLVGQYQSAA